MIAYLSGTILKKLPRAIIISNGAIGYLVNIIEPLAEQLEEEKPIELFIYTKVREDDISLYGFATYPELEFFKILLSVNGIGSKLALEILSQNPEKVKSAILLSDINALSKIPGIGKKTAERIIVELKNKIDFDLPDRKHSTTTEPSIDDDTVNALKSLGYQSYEIYKVLKNLPDEISTSEEKITYFLRNV